MVLSTSKNDSPGESGGRVATAFLISGRSHGVPPLLPRRDSTARTGAWR